MVNLDGWDERLDTDTAEAWTIALLLAVTLALRLYILPDRWINPDEGAHLMDAALALRGYVPEVDFLARQPLYVYVMAGFFKLTGISLEAGRFFPMTCSLLVGAPLYLLARDLFGRSQALLALAAWWLLPFEVRASTVVKTEPFAILLAVTCVLAVVRSVDRRSLAWMLGAGMLGAAGFYVRESALVIPPTVIVFLIFRHGRRIGAAIRDFAAFMVGYAVVCLLAALFYAQFVGAEAFVAFTPVHFVADALRSAAAQLPQASVDGLTETSYAYGEDAAAYVKNVKEGIYFQLFLIFAAGFAAVSWLWSWWRRPGAAPAPAASETPREYGSSRWRAAMALAFTWAALLGLAYAYHFSQRGFWVDYSREFAPALILATVGWLPVVAPALKRRAPAVRAIAGALLLGTGWVLFQKQFRSFYGVGHHVSLGVVLFLLLRHVRGVGGRRRLMYALAMTAILLLIVGARYTALAGVVSGPGGTLLTLALALGATMWVLRRGGADVEGVPEGAEDAAGVAALVRSVPLGMVVGAAVLTLSYGALHFNIKFQGVWSPQALAEVSAYVRDTTSPEDEVMSGGVVWELNARRLPWGLYSHPMVIQRVLPAEESRALTEAFKADPPEVIVMDGITEWTFGPNIQQLDAILATYYELVMEPEPVTFDVKVYRRIRADARP